MLLHHIYMRYEYGKWENDTIRQERDKTLTYLYTTVEIIFPPVAAAIIL